MKFQQLCLSTAIIASLSFNASAIELAPSEELLEALPSQFAKVTVVPTEDPDVMDYQVAFHPGSVAWTPQTINQIMNAYGKSISPEDAENIPGWYAKVVDATDEAGNPIVDEEGNPQKDLKYSTSGAAWKASSLHRIFSTYGLNLPLINVEGMPRNFTKVIKETVGDEEVDALAFDSSHILWSGHSLARILLAYE